MGNNTFCVNIITRVLIPLPTFKARCGHMLACGPSTLEINDYCVASHQLCSRVSERSCLKGIRKTGGAEHQMSSSSFPECMSTHVSTYMQGIHTCTHKNVLCYILESQRLRHRWGKFPKPSCLLSLLYSVYYYCSLFPGSICHRRSIQGQHLTYPQLSIACSQRKKMSKETFYFVVWLPKRHEESGVAPSRSPYVCPVPYILHACTMHFMRHIKARWELSSSLVWAVSFLGER